MLHRLGWVPSHLPFICPPSIFWVCTCVADSRGRGKPILWSEEADFISVQSILGLMLGELPNPADRFPLPELLSGWAAPGGPRRPPDTKSPDEFQCPRERRACLLHLPSLQSLSPRECTGSSCQNPSLTSSLLWSRAERNPQKTICSRFAFRQLT